MQPYPQRHINMGLKKLVKGENAIPEIGKLSAAIGSRALIIGGPTALSLTSKTIKRSMDDAGLPCFIEEYRGFCSKQSIQTIQDKAKQLKADLIITVGGGALMDTGKAVGYFTQIPVITIPTIAATCAAWAPVSVLYDNEHYPDGGMDTYAPEYVICDPNIIMNAPKRYIAAGLGDSLAKWPELGTAKNPSTCYSVGISLSKHLYYQCLKLAEQFAACDDETTEAMTLAEPIIDNVIMITGLCSELTAGAMVRSDYPLIAHGVDNALLCYSEKAHQFLHGERVSFGLIPHLIICGAPKEQIREVMKFLVTLKLPYQMEDFGLCESDIPGLSSKILAAPGIGVTGVTIKQIEDALHEARSLPWKELL